MLVFFYQQHFASDETLAHSFHSYQFTPDRIHQLQQLFNGNDYPENFKILKRTLANMAVSVPTLFKQYGELCDNQGVKFLDFGIDPEFGDCIDGLVLVDIHQLKPIKYQKYLAGHLLPAQAAS
jgi:hypothetical protein